VFVTVPPASPPFYGSTQSGLHPTLLHGPFFPLRFQVLTFSIFTSAIPTGVKSAMELKPAPGLRWAYLIKEPFSMFQIPVALHEMKLKKFLDGCSYGGMSLVPG
jgi:hypothetical protein